METPYEAAFFRQDPVVIARQLLGSVATLHGPGDRIRQGSLVSVDVLVKPDASQDTFYFSPPGTFVRYATGRGFHLAIACHLPGVNGIISFLRMTGTDEIMEPTDVYQFLGGDLIQGKLIGKPSGLYIAPGSLDLAEEGLVITDIIPPGSPANKLAYFAFQQSRYDEKP